GDEVETLRTEDIDEELGDVLLQLGALELEHRRARIRLVRTGCLGRQDPQLGHLEGGEFGFDPRQTSREQGIVEQSAASGLRHRGIGLGAGEVDLRGADASEAGSLITEQEIRVRPSLLYITAVVIEWGLYV